MAWMMNDEVNDKAIPIELFVTRLPTRLLPLTEKNGQKAGCWRVLPDRPTKRALPIWVAITESPALQMRQYLSVF
jgi:hypothetical protein